MNVVRIKWVTCITCRLQVCCLFFFLFLGAPDQRVSGNSRLFRWNPSIFFFCMFSPSNKKNMNKGQRPHNTATKLSVFSGSHLLADMNLTKIKHMTHLWTPTVAINSVSIQEMLTVFSSHNKFTNWQKTQFCLLFALGVNERSLTFFGTAFFFFTLSSLSPETKEKSLWWKFFIMVLTHHTPVPTEVIIQICLIYSQCRQYLSQNLRAFSVIYFYYGNSRGISHFELWGMMS